VSQDLAGDTAQSVTLHWTKSTSHKVLGYEISWGAATAPWGAPVFIRNSSDSLSYTIPGDQLPSRGRVFEMKVRTVAVDGAEHNSVWVKTAQPIMGKVAPPTQVQMASSSDFYVIIQGVSHVSYVKQSAQPSMIAGGADEDYVKVIWQASPDVPSLDESGYELSWGATTEPWSAPVFTHDLSYVILPEQLSASGTWFEVRVRAYNIMRVGKGPFDIVKLNSDWVKLSPIRLSFAKAQTGMLRHPKSKEKYRASLTKIEVLSDSDAGYEADSMVVSM
ncbi:MAG: hypothetical protein AAF975_05175, partial [Spirochaetota bacterium]